MPGKFCVRDSYAVVLRQEPSASLLSFQEVKVKDLLPDQLLVEQVKELDQTGSAVFDQDDGDDWSMPSIFGEDQLEEREMFQQRGLCANELDITSSVIDLGWSVEMFQPIIIIIIIFTLIQPRQTARPTTQCHIDTSVSQDSCTSRPRLPRRAANGA